MGRSWWYKAPPPFAVWFVQRETRKLEEVVAVPAQQVSWAQVSSMSWLKADLLPQSPTCCPGVPACVTQGPTKPAATLADSRTCRVGMAPPPAYPGVAHPSPALHRSLCPHLGSLHGPTDGRAATPSFPASRLGRWGEWFELPEVVIKPPDMAPAEVCSNEHLILLE